MVSLKSNSALNMPMKLGRVLRQPFYAGVGILSSMLMLGLYVYTQVLGNLANVDIWLANVPRNHALFLGVFVILFGITFAYQVYLWRQPKACSTNKKIQGGSASGIGTLGIFLIAQCPACASLGALFLPVSAISFFSEYAVELNLLSIGLLLATLYHLGAFERAK